MNNCIFCKLIAGEIPSVKVYEDDDVLAFMDIAPLVHGHTLVIPKLHVPLLADTPDDILAKVIRVVRRVARAQQNGLGAEGVNIHQSNGSVAGQVVPHLHFHVIPRYQTDGHHWNWSPNPYDNPDEAAAIAERIRAVLNG
ncbi:MAG: HIT family protein [Lentisphaerae bacterium]|jgi:histidine triad (HIT) family protein|nr:HIT family protein [Lentisphaerota bacterium]